MATSTDRDEYATLWHWTARALMAHGCVPADAVEGANLVLDAYRRERSTERDPRDPGAAHAAGDARRTPVPEAPRPLAMPVKAVGRTRTG